MISLILGLVLLGVLLYLLEAYVPMDPVIKTVIRIVVVVCVVYYLVGLFGFADLPVPSFRHR